MTENPRNVTHFFQVDSDRRRILGQALGISSILVAPSLLLGCGDGGAELNGGDLNHRVQVLSLQTPTPNLDVLHPREENESIIDVAKREIADRQLKLAAALTSALTQLKSDSFRPHVTFFTAPEIYWNIPWILVKNEEELQQLSMFYRDEVKKQVQQLIGKFPAAEWGKLILLPGTNALLSLSRQNPNRYEAINYVVAANNFGPGSEHGTSYVSIWPKRNTALIDFLGLSAQIAVEKDEKLIVVDMEAPDPELFAGDPPQLFIYQLSDTLSVPVYELSTVVAEHDTNSGYAPLFDNQILPSIPFGIDICADFGLGRLDELKQPEVKLNFLIAAGQPIPRDISQLEGKFFPESLQYLIRNDGVAAKGAPYCEVLRVVKGQLGERVQGRLLDQNIWLYQLDIK